MSTAADMPSGGFISSMVPPSATVTQFISTIGFTSAPVTLAIAIGLTIGIGTATWNAEPFIGPRTGGSIESGGTGIEAMIGGSTGIVVGEATTDEAEGGMTVGGGSVEIALLLTSVPGIYLDDRQGENTVFQP